MAQPRRPHPCPCGGGCPRCQSKTHTAVERAQSSAGTPLPAALREQLETTAGTAMAGVRVHTGSASALAATALFARAYAVGRDIHFARGAYDPASAAGQGLIAHEAAHTVQPASLGGRGARIELSPPTDQAETDANRFANAFAHGERQALARAPAPAGVVRVYRQPDDSPRRAHASSPDRLRCRRYPHPQNPCARVGNEDLRAIVRLDYSVLPGDIGSAIVRILDTPATLHNAAYRAELLKTACCMLDPNLARKVREVFEQRRGHVGERFGRLATFHRCAILHILDVRAAARPSATPTAASSTTPGTASLSADGPAIRALSSARVQRARAALDRELFRVAGKPDILSFLLPVHTRYARRQSAQFIQNDFLRFQARINERSTFAISEFGATGISVAVEPAAYLINNVLEFFHCMFDQLDGTTSNAIENLIKSSPLRLLRVPDRLAAGVLVGMKNAIASALSTLRKLVTDPWSLVQPTIALIKEMTGPGGAAIACALGGDMGEHLATIVRQSSRRGIDALAYQLGKIAGPAVLSALLAVILPGVGAAISNTRVFKRLIAFFRSIRHRLPFGRRHHHHHHDEGHVPERKQLEAGEHERREESGAPHNSPAKSKEPEKGPTLDLFGGRRSQVPNAINVDLVAEEGVRASATALPFRTGSIGEIVASGPRAPFLGEAARVLQPGGRLFINATKGNKFGKLPAGSALERLGLRVVQDAGPLAPRFSGHTFRRTDGSVIPRSSVRTTILKKTQ